MFSRLTTLAVLLLTASAFSISCTKKNVGGDRPSAPPVAYCPFMGQSLSFTSPITITGNAVYQYRQNGNGSIASSPIRFAEIMVKNSTGTIIQCAETAADGSFSFAVPGNTGTYTAVVNSRANNSAARAYVMGDPQNNVHYSISKSFTTGSSGAIGTITATGTGTLEGGAFNILDQIVNANVFLRSQTTQAKCDAAFTAGAARSECYTTVFSVAPLVYAYWTKGFNPNTYLDSNSATGVSFYLRGTNELYILGGMNGDVDYSDADHFDNTIIVHEYGHFIENEYSASDSPGGSHMGDETVDPRLGWSEAWANFFQAAVSGIPVYRDTEGNESCVENPPGVDCTSEIYDENLEVAEQYDLGPFTSGEGNFHEFSMTRVLWDILDPHPVNSAGSNEGTENVTSPFAEMWATFAGPTQGFRSGNRRFRNIGSYFKQHENNFGSTNWSSAIAYEDMEANESDYATPLTLGGSCSAVMIQPAYRTDGSFRNSNLFFDNDFYAYYHAGGALKVRLDYVPRVSGNAANLNLIVWKNAYRYGTTGHMAASSRKARPDGNAEEINATLAAGWYMINVMADASAAPLSVGSPNDYTLKINNQNACPNP